MSFKGDAVSPRRIEFQWNPVSPWCPLFSSLVLTKVHKYWLLFSTNEPLCPEVIWWFFTHFDLVHIFSCSKFVFADVLGGARHGGCLEVLDRTER